LFQKIWRCDRTGGGSLRILIWCKKAGGTRNRKNQEKARFSPLKRNSGSTAKEFCALLTWWVATDYKKQHHQTKANVKRKAWKRTQQRTPKGDKIPGLSRKKKNMRLEPSKQGFNKGYQGGSTSLRTNVVGTLGGAKHTTAYKKCGNSRSK